MARQLLNSNSTDWHLSSFMKNRIQVLFWLQSVFMCLSFLFSQPYTYKRIILKAVKEFTSCTSVEQSLFKQIVTLDKIFPSSSFLRLLCLCTVGFYNQASSWSSSLGWTEKLCSQQPSLVGDWSHVLGYAQLVSHVLGSHASKGEIVTIEHVQLDIGLRVQL